MARTLLYTFEELPLLIDLGFAAGLVNGKAEITYTSDVANFTVGAVWLDGYRMLQHATGDGRYQQKLVEVERGSWLHGEIARRLEGEWADHIIDKLCEALDDERASRPDTFADRRRAERVGA